MLLSITEGEEGGVHSMERSTVQYTQNMAVKGTLRHSCNTPQYHAWYPSAFNE